jgi:hypothetical protein
MRRAAEGRTETPAGREGMSEPRTRSVAADRSAPMVRVGGSPQLIT